MSAKIHDLISLIKLADIQDNEKTNMILFLKQASKDITLPNNYSNMLVKDYEANILKPISDKIWDIKTYFESQLGILNKTWPAEFPIGGIKR